MVTRSIPAQAIPGRPRRRREGLLFIVGGAVLAVITFVGIIFYTSTLGGSVSSSTVPVVVAARDVSIRVPISPADLIVAKYHTEDVPPGAFTKIADLVSLVPAINISKGQAITSNLVLRSGDAVLGPQSAYLPIPTGFVALTIPTGEQAGVAGYIQVGDYISLVAAVTGKTAANVRTIYTNIPVVRVGTAPDVSAAPASAAPKTGGISTSLTIVVTQCQAEYIGWFLANGSLRYTLESYKDYKPQDEKVDASCPSVDAAGGVTQPQVAAKWPGIFS